MHSSAQARGSCVADFSTASFGCRETKNRSQPFAAGEKTVTHRPVQGRGFRIRFRQVAIERAFDQLLARDEIGFDVHNPECSMLTTGSLRAADYLASSFQNPALEI